MRNQHDQALVAWKDTKAQADAEREAAAKETDTVRQNEKEFAKGIPAGLLYGTAAGFAWIGDRLNWLVKNYKNDPEVLMPALEDLVSKHLENKSEAYKQGFDFGDVASMFGGPEDLVKAGATTVLAKMAKKQKTLTREEELAVLAEAQARDAKRWASRGEAKPPIEVREAYKEMGVDYEKVIPEPLGVSQPSGFTARNNQAPVDEAVAAKGAVKDRTMTAHTQSQANPMATSGMPPPDRPPNMQATVEEGAGIYAAKQTAGWDKGWDPEGFKAHVNATIYAKADAASKGKGTAPPEFWVYDEKAKELIVVKRKEDGSLYMGKAPKRPKIVVDTGVDGEPIYSDKIDLIVPEDGMKKIREMLSKTSPESGSQIRLPMSMGMPSEVSTPLPMLKEQPGAKGYFGLDERWWSLSPKEREQEARRVIKEFEDLIYQTVNE